MNKSKEFKYLGFYRALDGLCSIFWNSIAYVLLYAFLESYHNYTGKDLKDLNVFTIIALFNILVFPLGVLPWALGRIWIAKTSFDRIG